MADDQGGGGNNKIVLIATIVNTVGMLAVVVLTFLSFQKEQARVSVEDIQQGGAHGDSHAGDAHGSGDAHGGSHGEAGKKGAATPSDLGTIVPFELFQVNLASAPGSTPRFLRMNMSVELDVGNKEDEVKAKTPRIRDIVINLLNAKKASDIASPEGRDKLKDEIRRTTNSFLKESQVKNVYFTNFTIGN